MVTKENCDLCTKFMKNDKFSKEEIFQRIRESQERLMKALQGAWETMPEDVDPKERMMLLAAIEKTAKLRDKVNRKIFRERS